MIAVIVAIVVVANKKGQYLLIQESKEECRDKWFLPGGQVNNGEPITDAAIREVKEEAGINAKLTGLLYIDQLLHDNNDRIRFVFTAEYVSGTIKEIEDEHSMKARWVSLEEIENIDLRSPAVITIINKYQTTTNTLSMKNVHIISLKEFEKEMP
jgi:ADP-ribose pyrophosphatase YjhB (NUDIX family)